MPTQTLRRSSVTARIRHLATLGTDRWPLAFVFIVAFVGTEFLTVLAVDAAILCLAPLLLALFMMWRGLQVGRWVAALGLWQLMFFCCLYGLGLGLIYMYVIAAQFIVAIAIVIFGESTWEFVVIRLEKRRPQENWDTAIAMLTAGRASPRTGPRIADANRVKELATLARRRARIGRIVALGAFGVAACVVIVLALRFSTYLIGLTQELSQARSMLDPANPLTFIVTLFLGAAAVVGVMLASTVYPAVGYLAALVAPFVVCAPISVPFALRWHQPARLLVLRPFNRQELTRPLVQFLRDQIAGFGHVYTLADAALRVPIFTRIPIVLGQIALASFRFQQIRSVSDIFTVCRMMRRRFLRNLNWLFSLNKIFPVSSTNSAWQAAVSRLACEADLILIDLSGAKESVIWELQQCDALGRLDRVLLLARDVEREAVHRLLSDLKLDARLGGQLLTYDCDAPDQAARTTELIAARLSTVGNGDTRQELPLPKALEDPSRRAQLWPTVAVVAVLVALLGVGLVTYFVTHKPPLPPVPLARVIDVTGMGPVLSLELRGPHQLLLGGGLDDRRVMDLGTGQVTEFDIGEGDLNEAAVSPDGARLAYADHDGTIRIEDMSGRQRALARWPVSTKFYMSPTFAFTPDSAEVAIGWNNTVALWMPDKTPLQLIFESGPSDILLFSPDGRFLLAADSRGGSIEDQGRSAVEVWDVHDVPTLRKRWVIAGGIGTAAWSPDGSRIALTGGDTGIQVWAPLEGSRVSTLVEGVGAVTSVAFGPNSDVLVWTDGSEIMLHVPGQRVRKFERGLPLVSAIGVCCGGELVFAAGVDQKIAVWNIAPMLQQRTMLASPQ